MVDHFVSHNTARIICIAFTQKYKQKTQYVQYTRNANEGKN